MKHVNKIRNTASLHAHLRKINEKVQKNIAKKLFTQN